MKVNGKMIRCRDMESYIIPMELLLIKDYGFKVVLVVLARFLMINQKNLSGFLIIEILLKYKING